MKKQDGPSVQVGTALCARTMHRGQVCVSEADQPLPAKIRIPNTWEALEIPEGSNKKTHRKPVYEPKA